MSDNGGGGSGGNTSVFWEVRDGSKGNPKQPSLFSGPGQPPRGALKIDRIAAGHTDGDFAIIGQPDHPGLFKVTLRFRDQDWSKVPPAERTWIEQAAKKVGTDRVLTVHVPAIQRPMPGPGGEWNDMPWEIQWEW
jgi:hypothetical protein